MYILVPDGHDVFFDIVIIQPSCKIDKLVVDGNDLGLIDNYTLKKVTQDHTAIVTCKCEDANLHVKVESSNFKFFFMRN